MAEKWTERLMLAECAAATLCRMHESAPDAFLSALSTRDFGRFAECLALEAQARMLLPSDFEVLDSHRERIGIRYRLSWRFRLSRDGQTHEIIEQVAFVNVGPDGIRAIDLLCSGFLPEEGCVAPPAGADNGRIIGTAGGAT